MKKPLKDLFKVIPFRKLLMVLLAMAAVVQLAVITYQHFTGFEPIQNALHFTVRLLYGTSLSLAGALMIAIPDLVIIEVMNRSYSWNRRMGARIMAETFLTILTAVIVSTFITLLSNLLAPYDMQLRSVLVTNALIITVVNIILITILEGWLFFSEGVVSRQKADRLEKELSQIRFEVLKSQINPHFMFNSLNVLSGLIDKDVVKAQLFIDEFSRVYRYVLETIEKPVVTLGEELGFVRSYMLLQQIRYGEALGLSVEIPAEMLGMLMPPLSLQMVLENTVKHNIVNQAKPLNIEITFEDDWLLVRNNLQLKISSYNSTGIGQNNLARRYEMVSKKIPQFTVNANHYTAKLPLIKS
jgi:LytS/YehU family sensor histidine kinase